MRRALAVALGGCLVLSACGQLSPSQGIPASPTLTESPSRTPLPTYPASLTPSPVPTATATRTKTLTPTAMPTLAGQLTLLEDYDSLPGGTYPLQLLGEQSGRFFGSRRLNERLCPIERSSMQADLMVVDTGYSGDGFGVVLDLHGLGTVRSWYAQIGYDYRDGKLSIFCQAFSYSSGAPRYWNLVRETGWNEWHTFRVEVVPTDEGWQYAFRFLVDGEEVGYYQPPDKWDGNNQYKVIQLRVALGGKVDSDHRCQVLVDNYYGDISCYNPALPLP